MANIKFEIDGKVYDFTPKSFVIDNEGNIILKSKQEKRNPFERVAEDEWFYVLGQCGDVQKAKEGFMCNGWVHYVAGARDYCPECAEKERAIMDKSLLTQNLYDTIIADNNKFKEYWNTHPEEVEEICRKFSEKYVDKRCKYLKVEPAPLSCEEGFAYPGDRTFCLKKDRELLDLFECEGCEYKERPASN